jgi:hypothetical protein
MPEYNEADRPMRYAVLPTDPNRVASGFYIATEIS